MSVQRINYECPICGRRFGWFEVDKATRRSDSLFCTGCWQMIDVDDLIVYDDNPETAQTGCVGAFPPERRFHRPIHPGAQVHRTE